MRKNNGRYKANKERVDIHKKITDKILEGLKKGTAPWVCEWDRSGGTRMPTSFSSKKPYQGANSIMLLIGQIIQGYASSEWMTANMIKKEGGHIRKGERGSHIMVYRSSYKVDGKKITESEARRLKKIGQEARIEEYVLPCCAVVFNRGQAENINEAETLDDALEGLEGDKERDVGQFIKNVSAALNIPIVTSDDCIKACYYPSKDMINIPTATRFKSDDSFLATVFHEIAHSVEHKSRLGRKVNDSYDPDQQYAMGEVIAELSSALTCANLGVRGSLQHDSYIKGYIDLLESDKKAFVTAATKAQKITNYILDKTLEYEKTLDKTSEVEVVATPRAAPAEESVMQP